MKRIASLLLVLFALACAAQNIYVGTLTTGSIGTSLLDYYLTVQSDSSPVDMWFFNQPASPVQDYAGQYPITVPSGASLLAPSLFGNAVLLSSNTMNAVNLNGTGSSVLNLGSTNALQLIGTNSWSFEFLLDHSNQLFTSAAQSYPLFVNRNTNTAIGISLSLSTGNSSIGVPGAQSIFAPLTWNLIKLRIEDTSSTVNTLYGLENFAPSNIVMVTATYCFTNGMPDLTCYINGVMTAAPLFSNTATNGLGPQTNIPSLFGITSASNATNKCSVNLATYYTNQLTPTQVYNHYLAATVTNYGGFNSLMTTTFVNGLNWVDNLGLPLQLHQFTALWCGASNCFFIYSYPFTGSNHLSAVNTYDIDPVTNGVIYSTPNFAQNTFTNMGFTYTNANLYLQIPTYNKLTGNRCIYCPSNNNYVIWAGDSGTNGVAGFVLVFTNSAPVGPFNAEHTNVTFVPTYSKGDFSVNTDASNTNTAYFVEALYPNLGFGQLSSGFDYTNGVSPIVISTGGLNLEGCCWFEKNGVYFIIASQAEFYDPVSSTNVFYLWTTTPLVANSWSAPASIYAAGMNPYGTGLQIQSRSIWQNPVTGDVWLIGDHWRNETPGGLYGLGGSTPVIFKLTFTATNVISCNGIPRYPGQP